jgi:hypothetical protein
VLDEGARAFEKYRPAVGVGARFHSAHILEQVHIAVAWFLHDVESMAQRGCLCAQRSTRPPLSTALHVTAAHSACPQLRRASHVSANDRS